MANEEQLAMLKRSVEEWNRWRDVNPNMKIELFRADLRGASLERADLRIVNLEEADLREANLEEADLRDAYLDETNLSGANIWYADLSGVDLVGADLKEAYLYLADLKRAKVVGTKFAGVRLNGTHLSDLNLSQAVGLKEVEHQGPSYISTDTLQRSRGKIPEKFLKGCGLSDWEIESAKLYRDGLSAKEVDDILYRVHDLRVHQAIHYYSVFISYSMKNQSFAQKLYADLQNNGVRCWFASEDMKGGQKLHEQIDVAIRKKERLLLVLSESSMNSEWVKTEIAKARKKELAEKRRVLFPIGLVPFEKIKEWECFDADVGKDSAKEIREYFIPDFSQWEEEASYKLAFDRLLKDLRAKE
jgi:uncharacterized protein YjbI with pentapeptide repeats